VARTRVEFFCSTKRLSFLWRGRLRERSGFGFSPRQ
jgi:hypothetical protein